MVEEAHQWMIDGKAAYYMVLSGLLAFLYAQLAFECLCSIFLKIGEPLYTRCSDDIDVRSGMLDLDALGTMTRTNAI